jgi:hypothetical protein
MQARASPEHQAAAALAMYQPETAMATTTAGATAGVVAAAGPAAQPATQRRPDTDAWPASIVGGADPPKALPLEVGAASDGAAATVTYERATDTTDAAADALLAHPRLLDDADNRAASGGDTPILLWRSRLSDIAAARLEPHLWRLQVRQSGVGYGVRDSAMPPP